MSSNFWEFEKEKCLFVKSESVINHGWGVKNFIQLGVRELIPGPVLGDRGFFCDFLACSRHQLTLMTSLLHFN